MPKIAEKKKVNNDSKIKSQSLMQIYIKEFKKSKIAKFGMFIIIGVITIALLAPVISPYDPIKQNLVKSLQGPSWEHPFGTDDLGRDILSRVLYGTRIALLVGFIVIMIGMTLGVAIGLSAGYFGGWIDSVLMRVMDVLLAFPFFLLAIIISGTLGPGLINAMIAVGIASLPSYSRLARGLTLSTKESDYVQSARALGCSDFHIITRHILPNIIGPIIVYGTLRVSTAIISTAGLSFLGLGAQPPTPDWGAMLSQGRKFMILAPWLTIFPGMAIMITVLGFNFLGDGLRDAIDPKLRD